MFNKGGAAKHDHFTPYLDDSKSVTNDILS